MRLLIHVLVALMVAVILGGVAYVKVQERAEDSARSTTRDAIRQFQRKVHLQAALTETEEGEERNAPPATIDPTWFGDDIPRNALFLGENPWVEIAGPRERDLFHPDDPIAADVDTAVFWYNPYNGIVRGRVPQQVSDSGALDLYNEINDTHLTTLFADGDLRVVTGDVDDE